MKLKWFLILTPRKNEEMLLSVQTKLVIVETNCDTMSEQLSNTISNTAATRRRLPHE